MKEELLAAIRTIQDNADYIRRLVALSSPNELESDVWDMVASSHIQIDDSRGEVLVEAGGHEWKALDQSLVGLSISEARAVHRKMYDEVMEEGRKREIQRKVYALKQQQKEFIARQQETEEAIKRLEES